jgi:hypothetical protein
MSGKIAKKQFLSNLVYGELVSFYYFLYRQKAKGRTKDKTEGFTYHLKSGHYAMVVGIVVFHIPAVAFIHVLIANLAPQLLLVVTALHVYSFYFCVSFAKALKYRFIQVSENALTIRCGLLFDNELNLANIENVRIISLIEAENKKELRLNASLFGHYNVLVKLKKPISVQIINGINKQCNEILLGVDEPHRLVAVINEKLG